MLVQADTDYNNRQRHKGYLFCALTVLPPLTLTVVSCVEECVVHHLAQVTF